jgi:hypothetical protein
MGKAQANTEATTGVTFKSNKPEGSIRYVNPKKLKDEGITGVIVQGTYLGRLDENQFGKRDFKFESMTEKGPDGDPALVIINESGNLQARMSNIAVGDLVQVRYIGQEKITKSPKPALIGKLVHQWAVDTAE